LPHLLLHQRRGHARAHPSSPSSPPPDPSPVPIFHMELRLAPSLHTRDPDLEYLDRAEMGPSWRAGGLVVPQRIPSGAQRRHGAIQWRGLGKTAMLICM
jgi:hypothetical protein